MNKYAILFIPVVYNSQNQFIDGKDSVTLPKKSFQSLHNAKGLFNNMQKFNRLVTRVLPYLQPHVQSCGFTKKNQFRVLGLFNNVQKFPYLQSHVQGCDFTKKSFQDFGIV